MSRLADDLRIIDADSHLTERHDLFTPRAPAKYKDRVPNGFYAQVLYPNAVAIGGL